MGVPVPLDDLPQSGGVAVPFDDLPSGEQPGVLSELKRGYMQGALEVERQLGVALEHVLPESLALGRLARTTQQGVAEVAPRYERPQAVTDLPWYRPTRIAGAVGQSAASIAPGIGVGALALGVGAPALIGAGAAGAVAGFQEAESFYRQRLAEGVSEPQAFKEALIAFPAIGALNVLPFKRILGRAPGRLLTGGIEAITEIAEEPTQALIAGKDPLQATVEGAKEVGPASFIVGAALGGGSATSDVDRARFQGRVSGQPVPAGDLPAPPIPVAAYPRPDLPRLTGPPSPADFTVDPYGRAARPGEAFPEDRGLPAPTPTGEFVAPEGGPARPVGRNELNALEAARAERRDLGLGEADRIARRAVPGIEMGSRPSRYFTPPPLNDAEYVSVAELNRAERDTYFGEGRQLSSRTTPQTAPIPPVGTWRIDDRSGADGREIEQLVEIDLDDLEVSEDTGPEKWADVRRYAEWMLEGKEPPPIRVIQNNSGRLQLSDHRRAHAARVLGRKTIKAWVSWTAKSDRKDYGGPAGYTLEMARKGIAPVPWVPAREEQRVLPDDARAFERIRKEMGLQLVPVEGTTPLERLGTDPDLRSSLEHMKGETGWDTKGGSIIRDASTGEVTGRTQWLPRYPWYKDKPTRHNEKQVQRVIDKMLAGLPLGKAEQTLARWLADVAADRIAAAPYMPPADVLTSAQLEDNIADANDTALVARAAELDEAAVERLAIQHGDDTEGFLRAIRGFLDAQAAPTLERSAGSVTQEARRPAAINRDLFAGSDTEAESLARRNAVEQERLRREGKLTGDVPVETGRPDDLFSQARKQTDLTDRPAPVTPAAPPVTTSTEDVGQELWYNRRNAMGKGLSWKDISGLNDALKVREVQKSKIWPRPDYEQLVTDGMHPVTAHLLKQIYDAISVKPSISAASTDEQLKQYVETVQQVRDAAFEWARDVNAQAAYANQVIGGRAVYGQQIDIMALASRDNKFPMFDAVFPGGFKGEVGAANGVRARLLGGRAIAAALQPGFNAAKKATTAIGKGWPAPQEAWQRQFKFRQDSNGKWRVIRNANGRTVADGLESKEAAEERAKQLSERHRKAGVQETAVRLTAEAREGVPRRGPDENITTARLLETFGFKGVNFGNWMKGVANAGERQAHVNHAFDALMDLSDLLSIPPRALSLNGLLGLAIGAQGKGAASHGAAAHFVPGVNEINLTRATGAGSLAHEWAHALDHYFATQAGERYVRGDDPFLTHVSGLAASDTLRPEIASAFQNIVETMRKRALTPQEVAEQNNFHKSAALGSLSKWIAYFRRNLVQSLKGEDTERTITEFDALAARMMRGDRGEGLVPIGRSKWGAVSQTTAEVRSLIKDATGRVPSPEDTRALDNALGRVAHILSDSEQAKTHVPQMTGSDYYREATKLDRDKGGKAYWTQPTEMFARAFQSYVLDKLVERSARNDYLTRPQMNEEAVKVAKEGGFAEAGDRYPRGAERSRINAAFDTLVQTMQTRETERGTALYSNPIGEMFRVGQGMFRQALRGNERVERLFGADGPSVAPQSAADIPSHIEAGGGTYTMAPFGGLDPQTQRVLLDVMGAEEQNVAHERGNEGAPIDWAKTGTEAQALLDSKFGKTFNALVNRMPRSTANAATMEAYARIVNTAAKNVQAAVEQYSRTQSAQDLVSLNAAREQLGVVLAPFMGYRTEAGRALNILRKVQSDFADAQQIFDALGDGNEQAMRDFARRVKSAGSVADVLQMTMASYKPSALDMIREYYINSWLSGPWTHAVNTISNTAFMALDAAAEVGTSLVSRDVSTRAALHRFTGMLHGVSLGISNARKAFATGEPQLTSQAQIEGQNRAIPGRLGEIVRSPGRLLMAEDEFAKAVNFTGELYRLAMEESQRTGQPVEAVLRTYANNRAVQAQARAHADRMTFQTKLGPLGQGVMHLRELSKVGWLIAPFLRTPTNILKQAATYTPAALAMPSVRAQMKATGRDRALAKGRMMIGTTFMAGIAGMVMKGALTGGGPDDPEERALWMRTGRKPYSINPSALMRGGKSEPGDKWYRYNRFDPIGMLMGIAADMTEIGRTVQKGQADKVGTMLLSSIMLNLADKTYLRGIFDAIEAARDPKRYGPQWASGIIGAAVPNVVAQAARATDPYVREARGLVDTLKGRVPGVRETLPAKTDIAGEPIESQVFEPAAATEQRDDPLAEAMLELGVFRDAPGRKLKLRGRTVELTAEQYQDRRQFVQQRRWQVLTPMVQSPQFQALMRTEPARAAAALENAYTKIGTAAKLQWLQRNGAVLEQLRTAPPDPRIPSRYAEGL